MLHPLHEIIEVKLKESRWFQKYCYDGGDYLTRAGKLGMYVMRAVVVMGLALVASYVPAFGVFTSLVGSTVCALISFVLPTIFHLKISGSSLPTWQKALDVCILSCGFLLLAMVLTTPSLELQGILATFILDCCLDHRTGGGTKSFHPLSYSGLLSFC
ncbi:Amino acid transporter ANT1 [Vitis vinifera]|uniref:Amino acid transporter ANT1 n=1 Tax=Vitis vinifera TaxID=29760 RepID=A0A438HDM5_VITVI|nr:Amino acid transporter ANT1 [Vitis vinifera]